MAFTMHRQRQISSRAPVFSGVLGAGLLRLLLAAPLSWAQIGGEPPAKPFTDIKRLQVTLTSRNLDTGQIEVSDPHCVQLNPNTWTFISGFSGLFSPATSHGAWYGHNPQQGSQTLLTAHITVPVETSAGRLLQLTISYSGFLDLDAGIGEGDLLISDSTGDPYFRATYEFQEDPNCQIPAD
jgi:hypothetical protein